MRASIVISSLFHAALIFWAVSGLTRPEEFKVKPVQSVPVEILTPAEFTKVKAGQKQAKKEGPATTPKKVTPKVAPKKKSKNKRIAKTAPPPPKWERSEKAEKPKKKTVKPKPKPKPKKAKVVKKKKPKKVKKPKPKPNKKTASKTKKSRNSKRKFNADKISALLNKLPDSGGEQRVAAKPAPKPTEPVRGRPRGEGMTLSISEIDAFRRQIEGCWNPPIGGLGAERLVVKIQFAFNRDGTLASPPRVVNSGRSPVFQAVADSALRAIIECEPYELNMKKYEVWRDMTLNFDPRQMYGG